MADSTIMNYGALAALAAGDSLEIVDVSDTSQAASGTNKRVSVTTLFGTIPVDIVASGTANRFGTPTTNDTAADTMFSASGTGKSGLVVQGKENLTVSPFVVQQFDGTPFLQVQRDGGLIIDQRTGTTFTQILTAKYQGTAVFNVSFNGQIGGNSLNIAGGNATIADTTGIITSLNNIIGRHFLGNGTSPTVADNGDNGSTIAGKDAFCKVTVGTGVVTSITITFGTTYATAPVVNVNSDTSIFPIKVTSNTTTATITGGTFTAGEVLHVSCGGF